ncbi:hypothetical protein [Arthrobacter sp. JSM 101049]|uniref:hypothetical protein n=1 Tax=Arthrobacter sp. JSM 101049 TaxID=929097 RepID=UPI0035629118
MGEDERRSPRDRAADEAAWQDLVSRLGDVGQDDISQGIEPDTGQDDAAGQAPADSPAPGDSASGPEGRTQPPAPAGPGPRDYALAEEPEEDWTPEEPPALGAGNPLNVLAWTCGAGAPIALLLVAIFWRTAPATVWVGLCIVFVAAAGYLAFRLPRHRTEGDDGARV